MDRDTLVVQTRESEITFACDKGRVAGSGYFQRDRFRESTEIRKEFKIST
jgi:hypothetical protein